MAGSEEIHAEFSKDEFLTCCNCKQPFDERDRLPKYLPCLHSVCKQCLREKVDADSTHFDCPKCRRTVKLPVKGSFLLIPDNYLIHNLKLYREIFVDTNGEDDKPSTIKCENCSDNKVASSFCKDCGTFLCELCAGFHKKIMQFRNHTVLSITDLPKENVNPLKCHKICPKHSMEYLTLYCQSRNCEKAVCSTCALLDHDKTKGHKLIDLSEIAEKVTDDLQEQADVVRDKDRKLQDVCNSFDIVSEVMKQNCKLRETEMRETVAKLHEAIDRQFEEINKNMHRMCDAQEMLLTRRKRRMEALRSNFTSALEFTDYAFELSHPAQLLSSRRHISRRLEELKAGDVPEKENYEVKYPYHDNHEGALNAIENAIGNLFGVYQIPPPPPTISLPELQKQRSESVGSPIDDTTHEFRARASSNPNEMKKVRRAPPPPRANSVFIEEPAAPARAPSPTPARRPPPVIKKQPIAGKLYNKNANQKQTQPISPPARPPVPSAEMLQNLRNNLARISTENITNATQVPPKPTERKKTRRKSLENLLDTNQNETAADIKPPPKPIRDSQILDQEKEIEKEKVTGKPPLPTKSDKNSSLTTHTSEAADDYKPATETAEEVHNQLENLEAFQDSSEHTSSAPSSASSNDTPHPDLKTNNAPHPEGKTGWGHKSRRPPPKPPVKVEQSKEQKAEDEADSDTDF